MRQEYAKSKSSLQKYQEFDSGKKKKNTVFNNYKESAKLPNPRESNASRLKSAAVSDNLVSKEVKQIGGQPDRSHYESSKIIKKIAESLDAWQSNIKLK